MRYLFILVILLSVGCTSGPFDASPSSTSTARVTAPAQTVAGPAQVSCGADDCAGDIVLEPIVLEPPVLLPYDPPPTVCSAPAGYACL